MLCKVVKRLEELPLTAAQILAIRSECRELQLDLVPEERIWYVVRGLFHWKTGNAAFFKNLACGYVWSSILNYKCVSRNQILTRMHLWLIEVGKSERLSNDLISRRPSNENKTRHCQYVARQCFQKMRDHFPGEPSEKIMWRLAMYGKEMLEAGQGWTI